MSVQELGDIDGVQMWWCPDCQASTPALKRNKVPELKHADNCGKLTMPAESPSAAPMPEQPRVQPLDAPARIPLADLKSSRRGL